MASNSVTETRGYPRRAQHDALRELRAALDAALATPVLDDQVWVVELTTLLARLGRVFSRHVQETEAPRGSLAEIVALKPHLESRVRRVKEEHVSLRRRIEDLSDAAKECRASGRAIPVEALRAEASAVSTAIRTHQARGIDLVYEAFNREEGAG